MGDIREHNGRSVLTYLQENPNRPITVEEVTGATGIQMNSISTAISRHMRRDPRITRVGRGIYRYSTDTTVPEPEPIVPPKPELVPASEATEFIVTVVSRSDGKILVTTEDGDLFKMIPFKF